MHSLKNLMFEDFVYEDLEEDSREKSLDKKIQDLHNLISQKNKLLMQYKAGILSIEDYKKQIGDIPQQIKTLRVKLGINPNKQEEDN
jgi:hypothetical protein